MFKNFWFQAHWLIGITAGVVLAIVGLTGGILSFETEIQRWLNNDVRSVTRGVNPLTPADIATAVSGQRPGQRIASIVLSGDPTESARVTFAPPESAGGQTNGPGPGRGPRGETRYVNPYTGSLIEGEAARGQGFFRATRSLHRWLTAGEIGNQEIGKQLVGASTLLCVVLALSGLYLRWPRRVRDWRSWLTFDPALKGRSFLWHLHAVIGTWVMVGFLLMSLTGLYWSYDWYRNGLYSLAGVERPAPRGEGPQQAQRLQRETRGAPSGAEGRAERSSRDGADPEAARPAPPAPNLAQAWSAFTAETMEYGFSTATFTLPQQPGRPIEVRYIDADPAHERATNTLSLDALNGNVLKHERYADKRTGEKFMASIFPLHSGSFFGTPGVILYMIASLAMPLFAITGWMLYLDRRKKKRAALAAQGAATRSPALPSSGVAGESLLLGFASQAGFARQIAWQTAGSLQAAGVNVNVHPLSEVGQKQLQGAKRALFVVSTFGEGEPPDEARTFVRRLMEQSLPLKQLKFGLLAVGDRQYKTFCEFGHSLDQWLRLQGAERLFPPVEVDSGDPRAIEQWRQRLGDLSNGSQLGAWVETSYGQWRLIQRRLLNAGSVGGDTFHVELRPLSDDSRWEAGDIAEVQPANSPLAIQAFCNASGLDAAGTVTAEGTSLNLAEALKYCVLPDPRTVRTAEQLADSLKPLPKREFSIASLPQDGSVHLVIRQAKHEDGTLGLGSGWLTAHAPIGAEIRLRVRSNPGFHCPEPDRPLILIGNGTGIAGLRSLIKARALQPGRNWLIFGERNAARDYYYGHEIEQWQAAGTLERVDLAFSRDQQQRIYVQHRLREQAERLREWLGAGAAVYICGSLEGMAPGVESALVEIIGTAALERLEKQGRYRRDVY